MKKTLYQLSLILVLLSGRYYVNTDHIDYIDTEKMWIKVGNESYGSGSSWYINVTQQDIETLKKAMGVYGD